MKTLTEKLSEILLYGLAKDFTSVSYAIMKDGELLACDSLGTLGDDENTAATTKSTYNVASVSKIYCAVAVMQLVEQGKVDLDTPVFEYLPRFYMPDERFRKITLRHCLSHTSGLPGTQWKGFSVSNIEGADYYADVYDYMANNYLKAEPGEYAVYCNDGFTLAEMVVAEVTGEPYANYCMNHITEPIGAPSTRLAPNRNPEYPLVHEKNRTEELLLIQGGAGFTTCMSDLCTFGNHFLTDSSIISNESKAEMAQKQGRTFLSLDESSTTYGLGWDTVCYTHPDYDLGEGVLLKGGNSFQFTTKFIVIPKYNAVLAISETHDCRIDVTEAILRMFAVAMLEQGINIYKNFIPIPEEYIAENAGTYLVPSGILHFHMYGAHCSITMDDTKGDSREWLKPMYFDGTLFHGEANRTLTFEKYRDDNYALLSYNGITSPMAQKVLPAPAVSETWKNRVGKKYIVTNATPYDIVINEIMSGFQISLLEDNEGIIMLSFSGSENSGVYGLFEAAVKPINDNRATGFLNTPSNPSRDLMSPVFTLYDDIEYCTCASYHYRDVSTLPLYAGQGFAEPAAENKGYRFEYQLAKLPEIPEGRRLMVLNENLKCTYDSLTSKAYTPIDKGYILFI